MRRVLCQMAEEAAFFGDSVPPKLKIPFILRCAICLRAICYHISVYSNLNNFFLVMYFLYLDLLVFVYVRICMISPLIKFSSAYGIT